MPTLGWSESCQRFWDFDKEAKPYEFKIERRRVPSYVKRFRQLVAHTPYRPGKLMAYKTKRIKPRSTWGTYGWEKSVVSYRQFEELLLAKLFVLGVEREHLGDSYEMGIDIDVGTRLARELRCLNRKAGYRKHTAFFQTERLG